MLCEFICSQGVIITVTVLSGEVTLTFHRSMYNNSEPSFQTNSPMGTSVCFNSSQILGRLQKWIYVLQLYSTQESVSLRFELIESLDVVIQMLQHF